MFLSLKKKKKASSEMRKKHVALYGLLPWRLSESKDTGTHSSSASVEGLCLWSESEGEKTAAENLIKKKNRKKCVPCRRHLICVLPSVLVRKKSPSFPPNVEYIKSIKTMFL